MFGSRKHRLVAVAIACTALSLGNARSLAANVATYVVRPHDTLSRIALTFGTTVRALEVANGLSNGDYIVPGQVLVIPDQSQVRQVAASSWACGRSLRYYRADGDRRWRDHAGWRHDRDCPAAQPTNGSASAATPAPTQYGASPTVMAMGATAMTTPVATATAMPATVATTTTSDSIAALLTAEAQAAGVAPSLVKAVAWQESGWRMVIAADGGIGIMQLMPHTVTWVETSLLRQTIDPYNATDNVRAGVALLRYYLGIFGNERLAIAAYHQGLRSVQTRGVSAATSRYVANVLALQQRFE